MPAKVAVCALAIGFAGTAMAIEDPSIQSRKLSDTKYELSVTLHGTKDVFAAQQALTPEAKKLCTGQPFYFGRYEFGSTEAVGKDAGSTRSPPPNIILRQEVVCGRVAPPPNSKASYDWKPEDTDSQLVAARTREYLGQKDRSELALAYDQFSDTLKATTEFDAWSKEVKNFNSNAGLVELRKILNVSWVKDPPGVAPGFYAAVDYAGRFERVHYECGFVAWYRDISGSLTIASEEHGYISHESEIQMTPETLRDALKKIQCVSLPLR